MRPVKRMHRIAGRAALLLAALLAARAALAEQQAAGVEHDLYLQALQSIAEGRRSDATAQLDRLIALVPEHAGAWLELALTQCSLGNADAAERLFAVIETRFSPSPAIRQLIAETREAGCARPRPPHSASLALGRGHDGNVNQGARTSRYVVDAPGGQVEYALSSDFMPRADNYTQLWGEYSRELTHNGLLGFAQYQLRRNDHLHQYDAGTLFAGVDGPYRIGAWRLRAGGSLGLVTLGGSPYQRQAQLQARATPPLGLPAAARVELVGTLTLNRFPSLTNFDAVVKEGRAHLAWQSGTRLASAAFGWQDDHALASRPGGDRRGAFANLLLRAQPAARLSAELGLSFQSWRSSRAYSPGLIEQARAQRTALLRASLGYAVAPRQALVLEARLVRNRENISIFQYDNRQLQFGWQWQLP